VLDPESQGMLQRAVCQGAGPYWQSYELPSLTRKGFGFWGTMLTGPFATFAQAKVGGKDWAYFPTSDGAIVKVGIELGDWNDAQWFGWGVLASATTGNDKVLLVADQSAPYVYVVDPNTPMSVLVSIPLSGIPTSAVTIGPDAIWYVVIDNNTLIAVDPPTESSLGIASEPVIAAPTMAMPVYLRDLGEAGTLIRPEGVAPNGSAEIAVADAESSCLQVFGVSGNAVRTLGRLGISNGNFKRPQAVAVAAASDGRLYVADTLNDRIQVLNNGGNAVLVIGKSGSARGEFRSPGAVAVDSMGRILVADTGNDRIEVFSSSGEAILVFGSSGSGPGELDSPSGITVDGDGTIYVADTGNNRIQAFDGQGNLVSEMASGGLKGPAGLALAADGSLFVSDRGNNRIVALDVGSGTVLGTMGGFGTGKGEFDAPHGLAWNTASRLLYVADSGNSRVQVFGYSSGPVLVAGPAAPRPGKLVVPSGVVSQLSAGPSRSGGTVASGPVSQGGLVLSGVSAAPNPPNPRNGVPVAVSFTVNRPASIEVTITDKQGRLVKSLSGQSSPAIWDGQTDKGTWASPGVYSVNILARDGTGTASQTVTVMIENKGGNLPTNPGARGRGK